MSIDLMHLLERTQLQQNIMSRLASGPILTASAPRFYPTRRLKLVTVLGWWLCPDPRNQDPKQYHAFSFVEYYCRKERRFFLIELLHPVRICYYVLHDQ